MSGGLSLALSQKRLSGQTAAYGDGPKSPAKGPSLRYVRWCEDGAAHLIVWPIGSPYDRKPVPFRCRSWRHPGDCQRWKGAQDFVRCRDAILSRGKKWIYIVLTLPHRRFKSEQEAYRAGYRYWHMLNKRLTRAYGRIAYIQTWEKHKKSDFPHVNIVLHNDLIWGLCRREGWKSWRQEFMSEAVEVGFGCVLWVAPLRPGGSLTLAGYLTKLSRELTGAGIKDQVPVNAPPHFRRLRASRKLLPKPFHRDGWTGRLVHP